MTQLSEYLVGHWPLTADLLDHSPLHHATIATDVYLGKFGPGIKADTAARFNGATSALTVADHNALHPGTADFSLTAWVHTDGTHADIVGDIIGKYDTATRKGYNLSILTSDGVTAAAQSNYRHLQFGVDDGRRETVWRDHGRPGNAVKISALTVSHGDLYAGTIEHSSDQVGRLWRYDGGQEWVDLGNPVGCNGVISVAEYMGSLYAGTGRYKLMGSALGETLNLKPGGIVFRITEDGAWIDCGHPGLQGSTHEPMADGYATGQADMASALTVFHGHLYCSQIYRNGVFRYEGNKEWSEAGLLDQRIMSLTVYRGHLYSLNNGGQVCRLDGGDIWSNCGTPPGSLQTYSSVIHQGKLHVGTWPNGDVCRFEGGTEWVTIGRAGYEMEVMAGAQYNGKAYWGSLPMANVYRMECNSLALIANLDQAVVPLRRVWSMATFDGRLFAGTLPSGHIWSFESGKVASWDHTFPSGWRHVAAIKDGGVLRNYVDGKLVASSSRFHAAGMDLTNTQPLQIGFGAYEHFDGMLSDVRIYSRALNHDEVASLALQRQ